MSIAAAIFLAALGAILYFAVDESISGIDIQVIGVILMVAGAAGLVLEFLRENIGRTRKTERIVERPGEPAEREEIRDRRY
jgi:hypothetical protein